MKNKYIEQRGIEWYRDKIANVPKYRSASWQYKVRAMSPRQVIAIYKQFKKNGLFDKNWKPKEKNEEDSKYYQMTIFDLIGGKCNE